MRFVTAHNPTDGPVVIDHLGRTLGGGEWGAVASDMTHVATARGHGRLVVFENIGDGAHAPALPAREEAKRLEQRHFSTLKGGRGWPKSLAALL